MLAFFKKYQRDALYLAVILALSSWIVSDFQCKEEQALIQELMASTKVAINQADLQFRYYYSEIQREAAAFPEKTKDVWKRTRQIEKLVQRDLSTVADLVSSRYKAGKPRVAQRESEIRALQVELRNLADSRILLGKNDSVYLSLVIKASLYCDSAACAKPEWAALSTRITPELQVAGLLNLKFRILTAGLHAISACYSETQPRGIIEHFWMPMLSTSRAVIRPGEVFEADISLTEYPPRTDGMAVYVDNKPIAIKDGLAAYRRRFFKPGIHKIQVRVDVTNPYTKQVKEYSKTFEVLVVEPCPGE